MKLTHLDPYDGRRAAAYPDMGDQLDAIWKVLELLPVLPPDTAAMLQQIQQVKADYPKPPPSAGVSLSGDAA
ncbi:hypothetical protein [Aquitalea pelogenes]|uniref:hypothetical protein n=1 Tax=Aquitalea pelogenes TaxID=1293573 RepID=UPI0035B42C70